MPTRAFVSGIHKTIRRGKLNSQFIVTSFSVLLHAGWRSLFRFQMSINYLRSLCDLGSL